MLEEWIEEIERNKDIWSPGELKKVVNGVVHYSTLGMLMRVLIRHKIGFMIGSSVKEESDGFSVGGYNYRYLIPKTFALFAKLPYLDLSFIEKERTMTLEEVLDFLRLYSQNG